MINGYIFFAEYSSNLGSVKVLLTSLHPIPLDLPAPNSTRSQQVTSAGSLFVPFFLLFKKAYVNPFELLESLCLLLVAKVPSDHRTTSYREREVLK